MVSAFVGARATLPSFMTICSCVCPGWTGTVAFTVALHYFRMFKSLVEEFEVKNERCDCSVTLAPLYACSGHLVKRLSWTLGVASELKEA